MDLDVEHATYFSECALISAKRKQISNGTRISIAKNCENDFVNVAPGHAKLSFAHYKKHGAST